MNTPVTMYRQCRDCGAEVQCTHGLDVDVGQYVICDDGDWRAYCLACSRRRSAVGRLFDSEPMEADGDQGTAEVETADTETIDTPAPSAQADGDQGPAEVETAGDPTTAPAADSAGEGDS